MFVLPQTRSPRQALWKEWNDEHEKCPINPGEGEFSTSRRLRGRLSKACVKDHVGTQHPDIGPDLVLDKVCSRPRATGHRKRIKLDGRIQAVSLRPPLTPPAIAVAKATHVPSTCSSTGKDVEPVDDVGRPCFQVAASPNGWIHYSRPLVKRSYRTYPHTPLVCW
ncbi:hypothetical protein BGY98DRAFT_994099 [Russula aff. rugulosa BPL654]|nr:hypothetical protein BGY98DRAFT_994099 [Russula aff. rugulosa BPL654]